MLSSASKFTTGSGGYLADLKESELLHLSILRSPYGHARIKTIKVRKPAKGVTIFTPDTVNTVCGRVPVVWTADGMKMATQPTLASRKVRYVGEPVVCAAAPDMYQARDAIELVDVDYEPLEAVTDVEKAIGDGAPILHEELGDNVGLHLHKKEGDVERAFKDASVILEEKFRVGRVAPVAIEPRGVISRFDQPSGSLTVWSSSQMPYMLRYVLSIVLGLAENRIRVIAPNLGGGFGSKDSVYPEEALTSFAAMRLGRPVRWLEDRRENLMATNHDRDQLQNVQVAATKAGLVTALKAKVLINAGAYYRFHGARMAFIEFFMLSGQYKVPSIEVDLYSIFTNTMSTFPYRGPGSTEATFLIERVMDILAREMGMDPAEIRFKNLIRSVDFPYTTATGATYDGGDYAACLQRALQASRYHEFVKEKERAKGDGRHLGIGIGCYVDQTGLGPSKIMGSLGIRQGGWEKATVSIDQSGRVTVTSGIQPMGQGTETGIAQVVGKELGLPSGEITVLFGDTAQGSFGAGTFASRGLAIGGAAALLAAREVKEKMLTIAGHMLEARVDDLTIDNGRIHVKGSPSNAVTLSEIAHNSYAMVDMPDGLEPGLEASAVFDPPNFAFAYGTMIAKVEVDPSTGVVRPISLHAVHDCGVEINPLMVEHQMQGAMVQGLGEALLEGVAYDENGQLLSSTLADYTIPSATDIPLLRVESLETPSPVNPLGVRGVGESGIIGSPVALANAVEDALSAFKCRITQVPLRPEYIWRLIRTQS